MLDEHDLTPLRSTTGNLAEPFIHQGNDYFAYSWHIAFRQTLSP